MFFGYFCFDENRSMIGRIDRTIWYKDAPQSISNNFPKKIYILGIQKLNLYKCYVLKITVSHNILYNNYT